MAELDTLENSLKCSQDRYAAAMEKIKAENKDQSYFQLAAQEAQDAWNEYKKLELELNNATILKTRRDLYGC